MEGDASIPFITQGEKKLKQITCRKDACSNETLPITEWKNRNIIINETFTRRGLSTVTSLNIERV